VANRRSTSEAGDYPARKIFDRDLLIAPDVEDLTHCLRPLNQSKDCLYGVTHKAETACLLPCAEDGHVISRHRLGYEIGQHHSIAAGLPWPHNVEKAHYKYRQLFFLPVSQSKKLIEEFRSGIAPTSLRGGSQHQIVILSKGNLGALAVHFRSGGNEYWFLFLVCGLQYQLGTSDIRFDRANRTFDDQPHT